MENVITCTPKRLPKTKWVAAAKQAVAINPVNHPNLAHLAAAMSGFTSTPERIALVTSKYWCN